MFVTFNIITICILPENATETLPFRRYEGFLRHYYLPIIINFWIF